jgi:ubiquinone/menaquinone biosynthesis C-methylase UbiE
MIFKAGPKFHNILGGGTFNLNRLTGTVSPGTRHRVGLEKFYDRIAPFYGIWAELVESHATCRAYELACLSEGDSVLEVAIGSGEFFSSLVGAGGLRRCVGVDRSPRMLARARNQLTRSGNGRHGLCRADAYQLPFAEATFDVLFNFYMLDLLRESEIPAVTKEFRRVLKPSGRLIVLNMAVQQRILNAVWMWIYHRAPLLVGGCRPVPVGVVLAAEGWGIESQEQISQCGFRSDLIVAGVPSRTCQP